MGTDHGAERRVRAAEGGSYSVADRLYGRLSAAGPWLRAAVLLAALALLWVVAGPRAAGGGGEPIMLGAGGPGPGMTTPEPDPADGAGSDPQGAAAKPRPARRYVVHVAGAVRRPGVYRVRRPARLVDAVERAGGPAPGADLTQINLAARLSDGMQIVVPAKSDAGMSGAGATGTATSDRSGAVVNLNTATAEELQTLDGVGPATAAAIVKTRTERGGFTRFEELQEVPGIGAKRLESLRSQAVL